MLPLLKRNFFVLSLLKMNFDKLKIRISASKMNIFLNFYIHCILFLCCFFSLSYRKRSRDEDTCDFMPISKRINNLTLEQEPPSAQHVNSSIASNQFMAINNQEIQSQHFAQHSLAHSYPNNMSAHYVDQHGAGQPAIHPQHHQQYHHQSHHVQSTNHSNGFHNGSHLAIGTNAHHKPNHQSHHSPHIEPNNNNHMEDVYSPELTPDENPFYYDKNKLLFDLHVERQRRHQSHHWFNTSLCVCVWCFLQHPNFFFFLVFCFHLSHCYLSPIPIEWWSICRLQTAWNMDTLSYFVCHKDTRQEWLIRIPPKKTQSNKYKIQFLFFFLCKTSSLFLNFFCGSRKIIHSYKIRIADFCDIS